MAGMMGVEPKGYNGVVDVNGQQIHVTNGKVNFQGQAFKVAESGVVSKQGQPVGMIQQGKFIPKQ